MIPYYWPSVCCSERTGVCIWERDLLASTTTAMELKLLSSLLESLVFHKWLSFWLTNIPHFHSHIFWTWVSVWIYVLYRFCVCLMFEIFMCLRSKDLCVCVQELLPIKVKKRTTRSKKADEKQLVKIKSGELMSSKVKASKHINKPVLMLF